MADIASNLPWVPHKVTNVHLYDLQYLRSDLILWGEKSVTKTIPRNKHPATPNRIPSNKKILLNSMIDYLIESYNSHFNPFSSLEVAGNPGMTHIVAKEGDTRA